MSTIYMAYLVNIKLGELECNANWEANSMILSVDCLTNTHNTHNHHKCWHTLNVATIAKIG